MLLQDMVINYVVDTWQKTLASAHSRSTKVSEKDVIFLLRKVSVISSGFCKSNFEGFWHLSTRNTSESILFVHNLSHPKLSCNSFERPLAWCFESVAWQRTVYFLPRVIPNAV